MEIYLKYLELILVGEEIINNQSKTILTFSGTTALSSIDKYISGSSKLKYMNPCARMEDSDGKKYKRRIEVTTIDNTNYLIFYTQRLSQQQGSVVRNYSKIIPDETITLKNKPHKPE